MTSIITISITVPQVNKIPWDNIEEELMKPENRMKDSMATYNYEFYTFLQQMHNFT